MILLRNKYVGLITNGIKMSSIDRINFLQLFSAELLTDKFNEFTIRTYVTIELTEMKPFLKLM